MKSKNILLWGGRSQALIAEEMIKAEGIGRIIAVFDTTLSEEYYKSEGKFLNKSEALRDFIGSVDSFAVCIGGEHGFAKHKTAQFLRQQGLEDIELIHHRAFIDPTAQLGRGSQVMPNATVHKHAIIGDDCILNTSCTIDHECQLGHGVHVMGNAAIAGKVTIGNFATIGTNATILPFLTIGEGAFVGAGAVVTKDVEPFAVVCGVPSRFLRKKELKFLEEPLRAAFPAD